MFDLIVAPSNGTTKRIVIATVNHQEVFRDRLDVNCAKSRIRFAQELAKRLNFDPNEVTSRCHTDLPRLADMVDQEVAEIPDDLPSLDAGFILSWPEPLPHAIPLADALDHAVEVITRYVVLPDHSAFAVALWAAWTYVYDSGNIAPLLAIVSPVRRCGKTRLLTCLQYLAARAILASNVTPSAIYRVIECYAPLTLLIDELDTFLDNEELRGIINAGHTREGAFVVRNVLLPNHDYQPRFFSTWCPKAIASIGQLHSTWEDRAIVVRMDRKRKDEYVERLNRDALKCVARELFTAVVTDEVRNAVAGHFPAYPDCLDDRAADNWQPLFAIADLAGGDWPQRARSAAIALSCVADAESEELPVRLLVDCLTVFDEGEEELTARELAERLAQLDDSPWPTYRHGKPISPEQVGRTLRRFGITPQKTSSANVYYREDIEWIAERYLSFSPIPPEKPPQPPY